MSETELLLAAKVFLFLLVFARVAGMLLFMPVIGGQGIPMQIRFFCAIAFTAMIVPLFSSVDVSLPPNVAVAAVAVVAEFLVGLAFSFAMYIFFAALLMAGDYIGRLGGISISVMFDPATGENVSVLARFFYLAGIAVFIAVGGLEAFMTGFIDSFVSMSPGSATFSPDVVSTLVSMLSTSMTLVVKIAAPVTVSTLAVFLVIGILGRSIPQVNVMSIGFGLNTMLMLGVLFLGLGFSIRCFQESIESALAAVFAK